jgi:hypothetical protein
VVSEKSTHPYYKHLSKRAFHWGEKVSLITTSPSGL